VIIDADFKGLEIVCAAYLSKDSVLYDELRTGRDIHSDNQERFGLPSRLVAKVFKFRILYGGSAYAFGHDPDFTHISRSEKYWSGVIDKYYAKYKGLHRWHTALVQEVVRTGKLNLPTGRVYSYERDRKGNWPRTTILNYPVQGLGADIMSIARVSLFKRLRASTLRCKLVSTVHDSIVLDCPEQEVKEVTALIKSVWRDIPRNFKATFGVEWDLPCEVSIAVGETWGSTKEI
jgi:DNA polymerase-1